MPLAHVARALRSGALLLALGLLATACGSDDPPAAASAAAVPAYDARGRLLGDVKAPGRLPNLVVVVIDTLRADALDGEGGVSRMPFLASLAQRGTRFTNAVAAAPWTVPSIMSLLTGLLPSEHGQDTVHDRWHMPDAVTTFAEALSGGYGYQTAALVGGVWFERSGDALLQGFDSWRTPFTLQDTEAQVGRWLLGRNPRRPFFLLLHTFEAHSPYGAANHPRIETELPDVPLPDALRGARPDVVDLLRACFLDQHLSATLFRRLGPELGSILQRYKWTGYAQEPQPALAEELRQAYWEGAHWVDGLLAHAWSTLGRQGLLDDTLFVVLGDHGEAFGEHGSLGHGLRLYDELVRVPLVMVGPAPFDAGRVVEEDVGLVDVLPTFFDWAGLAPLAEIEGRSALEVVKGGRRCRPVISEERLTGSNTGLPIDAFRVSLRTAAWKYILTLNLETRAVSEELYDLAADPRELDDLCGGTGHLPEELPFDECVAEGVRALRARVVGQSP